MYKVKKMFTFVDNSSRTMRAIFLGVLVASGSIFCNQIKAQNIVINGPAGSESFGKSITILTNGNYVISDPLWDNTTIPNVGAVYLYNGRSHTLISSLTGNTANDQIGSDGVTALSNGNFVVSSSNWNNSGLTRVGAVTWGNGLTGISGIVSASNSLIGTSANDWVGFRGATALPNGSYVVRSLNWSNGSILGVGAVTWCNGLTGLTGAVSTANSLVGNCNYDHVGDRFITVLVNGNYVIGSPHCRIGTVGGVGAVTWCNGSTGLTGAVSVTNSLVGSQYSDNIGDGGITGLPNGNYVVGSPSWQNGTAQSAGAATWGNGITGTVGVVSTANSLVGSYFNSQVGNGIVAILPNSNYVLSSSAWGDATNSYLGAVTLCNGSSSTVGVISDANSLIGSHSHDKVGRWLTVLPDSSYLVVSPFWDNGILNGVGAVTWGNGTTGITGKVSTSNSLVGTNSGDQIGYNRVVALKNGGYVINSPYWNKGSLSSVGAITKISSSGTITGMVSTSNSLTGSQANDLVGQGDVMPLADGDYLINSPYWSNGTVINAGAISAGRANAGSTGVVSGANSLIGTGNDRIGSGNITTLSNGTYVINSPLWNNSAAVRAGAVTCVNISPDSIGSISTFNSLVGMSLNDSVGNGGITALPQGLFFVHTLSFRNAGSVRSGAVTLVSSASPAMGTVDNCNSVMGTLANKGNTFFITYDTIQKNLLVGLPAENKIIVTSLTSKELAIATTSCTRIIQAEGTVPFVDADCKLIATLKPADSSFVKGAFIAKVYLQTGTPQYNGSVYVRRHYQITPVQNQDTAVAATTLYFQQSEFDDYNANNSSNPDLPTSLNDIAGISNLKVTQHQGTSTTGLPGSFTTTGTPAYAAIDPADSNIVWNASQKRWEVTFNTTGFGGFFIYGSVDNSPLSTSNFDPQNKYKKRAVLFPNPAQTAITILLESHAMIGASASILNIQGSIMQTVWLKSRQQSVDIVDLPAGFYFVKLANGEVLKFVKQ